MSGISKQKFTRKPYLQDVGRVVSFRTDNIINADGKSRKMGIVVAKSLLLGSNAPN